MSLQTLNDIFFTAVERDDRVVMMYRDATHWASISSRDLYQHVVGVARALRTWGISKGDRVAILSENRPEWTVTDFACLSLGAIVVPIYATLTAEQTAYILRDSAARAIFVSSEKQLAKVNAIRQQTALEKLVVMDAVDAPDILQIRRLTQEGPHEPDTQFDSFTHTIRPRDIATIIYTSGTTGTPKGVILTHANIASNINGWLPGFNFHAGHISLSFLPLSHITARNVDLGTLYSGATLAYVPFIEELPKALLEVRPTIFVGVPRAYEKLRIQVNQKAQGFPKRQIYQWSLRVGRAHRDEILAGKTPRAFSWKLANRLLYSKIRAGMGGRVELFISGGAPLGKHLAEWYADIGIRIHEGYGLTETAPVVAVNTPAAHKLGTVGKLLPNVEVHIADDGEILVRGPSVFQGYWNLPKETESAFVDGWFKSGDVGHMDAEGFLSVTDRKKDLIKTSGGKFIAPQPLENALKHNGLVGEAVLLGDKRKFPAVLISPHFPMLEDWANNNQLKFTSRKELISQPPVQQLYEGIVSDLNQTLARFEQLKKVLLIPDEFSVENGALTASMKVRRRVVEERYQEEIETMYLKAESERPQ
jgi:long-chain acyl-CoA synthetase